MLSSQRSIAFHPFWETRLAESHPQALQDLLQNLVQQMTDKAGGAHGWARQEILNSKNCKSKDQDGKDQYGLDQNFGGFGGDQENGRDLDLQQDFLVFQLVLREKLHLITVSVRKGSGGLGNEVI